MERVDKLLVYTGRWSRKEARGLVLQGRVAVNGAVVAKPEDKVEPEDVDLTVDGARVECARFVYLMLHKPAGYLSATEDRAQATVLDLLPQALRRRGLFPVGRLDKDTEGLLLLTDDGALAHRLLSPKYHVDKVYYAQVDGVLTQEDVVAFHAGIVLADGTRCLPARLEILEAGRGARVEIQEGKYHQIKRMLASRGKPVLYLKRCAMGGLFLDAKLPKGAWRKLEKHELEMLKKN